MRNLLPTLVLASVGLVLSTGEASAFFRKKKKCQPAPVVTYVATPCCGMPAYSGSSYSALPSAFPTYPQASYGNSGSGGSSFGPVRGVLGTVGSVGSGILSAPGNLYNRIR